MFANNVQGFLLGGVTNSLDGNYNGGIHWIPFTSYTDAGYIENLQIDGSGGSGEPCGGNVNSIGIQIDSSGGGKHYRVSNVKCTSTQGICLKTAQGNGNLSNIQSLSDNQGAQSANDYSVYMTGSELTLTNSNLGLPVFTSGSNNTITGNWISSVDTTATVRLASGAANTIVANNNISVNVSGGTGIQCDSGASITDGTNTFAVASGGTQTTRNCARNASSPNNPFNASYTGSSVASASTIAPVGSTVHVTGSSTVSTITVPSGYTANPLNLCINLISDGGFATTTGGNIATAIATTAGYSYAFCYDGSTWTPNGSSTGGTSLPVVDSTAVVKGASDATKLVKLNASSLSTGVTATVVVPNATNQSGGAQTDTMALMENSNVFQQRQGIQNGSAAPVTALGGLQVTESTGLNYVADFYGGLASFLGRRASGSSGSPTAVQSGQGMTFFGGGGYDGTSMSTGLGAAGIEVYALENWGTSAHGAQAILYATEATTTSAASVANAYINHTTHLPEFDPSTTGGQLGGGSLLWNLTPSLPDTVQSTNNFGATNQTLTTSFATLSTLPSITLPLAGKYLVQANISLDMLITDGVSSGQAEILCNATTSPIVAILLGNASVETSATVPVSLYYTAAAGDVCTVKWLSPPERAAAR